MKFIVRAYSSEGRIVESILEAEDESDAVKRLSRQGMTPFEVRKTTRSEALRPEQAISTVALVDFCRSAADLLQGGIPLADALKVLSADKINRPGSQLAEVLRSKVVEGSTLSQAIESAPFKLPRHFSGMVRSGEQSGKLGLVFNRLAMNLERRLATIEALRSALTYPAVLLATSVVSVCIILLVVAPTLKPVITDVGAEAPQAAVALIVVSDWLRSYWWSVVLGLAILPTAALLWWRTEQGSHIVDRIFLRLPIIGTLIKEVESARFLKTLATLLENGISLAPAIGISEEAASNQAFRLSIRRLEQSVRDGHGFSEQLASDQLYPQIVTQMALVGEETGRLAKLLDSASDLLETQVERRLNHLKNISTPVLTLLLGLIVGTVVLTLLSAIMSVNDAALQ